MAPGFKSDHCSVTEHEDNEEDVCGPARPLPPPDPTEPDKSSSGVEKPPTKKHKCKKISFTTCISCFIPV